jgi:hypothetical protein
MLEFLLISIGLILFGLIGFKVGYVLSKKKIKQFLRKGTGRLGIVIVDNRWSNISGVIEVEELEVAEGRTKVIIHDVIPDRRSTTQTKEEILSKWGESDWISTNTIIWYDNNSQRIRDIKLKTILNDAS